MILYFFLGLAIFDFALNLNCGIFLSRLEMEDKDLYQLLVADGNIAASLVGPFRFAMLNFVSLNFLEWGLSQAMRRMAWTGFVLVTIQIGCVVGFVVGIFKEAF